MNTAPDPKDPPVTRAGARRLGTTADPGPDDDPPPPPPITPINRGPRDTAKQDSAAAPPTTIRGRR